jgi:hypothetical protein
MIKEMLFRASTPKDSGALQPHLKRRREQSSVVAAEKPSLEPDLLALPTMTSSEVNVHQNPEEYLLNPALGIELHQLALQFELTPEVIEFFTKALEKCATNATQILRFKKNTPGKELELSVRRKTSPEEANQIQFKIQQNIQAVLEGALLLQARLKTLTPSKSISSARARILEVQKVLTNITVRDFFVPQELPQLLTHELGAFFFSVNRLPDEWVTTYHLGWGSEEGEVPSTVLAHIQKTTLALRMYPQAADPNQFFEWQQDFRKRQTQELFTLVQIPQLEPLLQQLKKSGFIEEQVVDPNKNVLEQYPFVLEFYEGTQTFLLKELKHLETDFHRERVLPAHWRELAGIVFSIYQLEQNFQEHYPKLQSVQNIRRITPPTKILAQILWRYCTAESGIRNDSEKLTKWFLGGAMPHLTDPELEQFEEALREVFSHSIKMGRPRKS